MVMDVQGAESQIYRLKTAPGSRELDIRMFRNFTVPFIGPIDARKQGEVTNSNMGPFEIKVF